MRTSDEIRADLERASRRRAQLWEALSQHGHDPEVSAEAAELSRLIDDLWAEHRALLALRRHGPAELIQARARAEERLERDVRRQRQAA